MWADLLVHEVVAQKFALSTVSRSMISGEIRSYGAAGGVEWLEWT